MATPFYYSRFDESFGGGTVTGTVESTYNANHLLDPSPLRPVRGTTGLTLTATAPAARMVGIIAMLNANLTGTSSVGAFTVPAATLGADGIYLNSFVTMTPGSLSSLVMTVSQTPSIVGGLWAGVRRQLERQLLVEPTFDMGEPKEWEGEAPSFPPYDPGISDRRRLTGTTIVSDSGLEAIHAWYRSTRKGTLPSLIVPIGDINDAWLVTFRYTWNPYSYLSADIRAASPMARSLHRVAFEFTEIPRVRWP